MKFGNLEQKLELSNQNICKKFLKNNAHIQEIVKKSMKRAVKLKFKFDMHLKQADSKIKFFRLRRSKEKKFDR
jgi:hypothetical protein